MVINKYYKNDLQSNRNKGFSLTELITFICIFAFTYAWSLFYFHGLGMTLIELFIKGPINKIGNFLRWTGSIYNYLLPLVFVICSFLLGRIDAVLSKSDIDSKNAIFQAIAIIFKIVYKIIDFISSTASFSSAVAVIGILVGKLKLLQLEELLYFGSYINIALSVVLAIAFMIFKAKRKPAGKKTNTSKMFKDVTATQKTKFSFIEHQENEYDPRFYAESTCFVLVGNNSKTKVDGFAPYNYKDKKYIVISDDKFALERYVIANQNNFGEYVALIARQYMFGAIQNGIQLNDMNGYIDVTQNECHVINVGEHKPLITISWNPNSNNISNDTQFLSNNANGEIINNNDIALEQDLKKSTQINRISKPTIIFNGETPNELTNQLINIGSVDWTNKNEALNDPIGFIVITSEYDNSWITNRLGYMGWNIKR